MLELEAAGIVRVSEAGLEIDRAPEGIRFEPLSEHPRLGELVGSDEKFAAHNAAEWRNGLLVHVPKGVILEQPLLIGSSTPSTAARSSGGCSSSPSRAAASP
jgi:Fe-S cluster assembly scaffold protein SufB